MGTVQIYTNALKCQETILNIHIYYSYIEDLLFNLLHENTYCLIFCMGILNTHIYYSYIEFQKFVFVNDLST